MDTGIAGGGVGWVGCVGVGVGEYTRWWGVGVDGGRGGWGGGSKRRRLSVGE